MTQTDHPKRQPPPALLAAMQRMRFADNRGALELAEAALPAAEEPAPYLALASLAALRLKEPSRAIPHLHALLAIQPQDLASRTNLANALVETGDFAGAIELTNGAAEPGLARIEGYARQEAGDADGAAAVYRRVLSIDPCDLSSLNNLGNLYAAMGQYEEAIDCFERAITLAPREVGTYRNLAEVLRRADRGTSRLKVMRDAQNIAPGDRAVLTELALAYAHADERSVPSDAAQGGSSIDQAIAILEDVVERYPEFGESHIELGRLYEATNRIDELATLVARVGREDAPPEAAFLSAWLAQRQGRFDDAASIAEALPETVNPMRRYHLIGSSADRKNDTATAFAAFEKMNRAAEAEAPALNGPTFRETVERDLQGWTPEWRKNWTSLELADGERDPIFLVGFPRSGTTLLDTMLMGSPQLSVLEEQSMLPSIARSLANADLAKVSSERALQARSDYFAAARKCGWDDSRWLLDKHPLNMVRLPLIHRVFPRARVILAERHPYDVVLSCFTANFRQNLAMRSFNSLEEAARTYDVVFQAWSRARDICSTDVHSVRYERLVENPRDELEPVVDWLGIEWDGSILAHERTAEARGPVPTASYAQIGEGLYSRSSGRWRRYAAHLAPILPILRPWADRMDYISE
jgi:tetratricopeptide (TPR) repeat protein